VKRPANDATRGAKWRVAITRMAVVLPDPAGAAAIVV